MPVDITTHAVEGSTFVIDAQFSDADDTTVVPNSIAWTLTDKDGTVQNSLEGVSLTAATTVTIVLSGTDLTLVTGGDGLKILYFDVDYDSTEGSGLPLREEARFYVDALVNVE